MPTYLLIIVYYLLTYNPLPTSHLRCVTKYLPTCLSSYDLPKFTYFPPTYLPISSTNLVIFSTYQPTYDRFNHIMNGV
jgi:hypothetical protein